MPAVPGVLSVSVVRLPELDADALSKDRLASTTALPLRVVAESGRRVRTRVEEGLTGCSGQRAEAVGGHVADVDRMGFAVDRVRRHARRRELLADVGRDRRLRHLPAVEDVLV